jgi:AraC-like DNA-binding protein
MPVMTAHADWLTQFVDRCQSLLGPDGRSSRERLAALEEAVARLPESAPMREHLLAIGLAAHVAWSIRQQRSRHTALPRSPSAGTFRLEARELLQLIGHGLPGAATDAPSSTPTDVCVRRALGFVTERYSTPLTLGVVARHAGVSPCHLARALKRHTGRAFLWHLHGARVDAAQRLLVTTTLSVKEVAAHAGYNTPTQLCRYFRRRCGTSPLAYRCVALRAGGKEHPIKSNS